MMPTFVSARGTQYRVAKIRTDTWEIQSRNKSSWFGLLTMKRHRSEADALYYLRQLAIAKDLKEVE